MGKRRTRKLTGQTSFIDPDAGTAMHSSEELEVGDSHTVTRIGPVDPRHKPVLVPSRDRKVVFYMGEIMRARKANEYRLQPVTPNFKPSKGRKARLPDMMPCPACLAKGEEDTGDQLLTCRTCNGLKQVKRP